MNKIGSVVSETCPDKFKSQGHVYSGRRAYSAKYGNGTSEVGFLSFGPSDGKKDGEHNSVSLVEISKTFAKRDDFLLEQYHLTDYN